MAIQFNVDINTNLRFSSPTAAFLTTKTYSFRVGGGSSGFRTIQYTSTTGDYISFSTVGSGNISFNSIFSTTTGFWSSTFAGAADSSTRFHVLITYNGSSTSNNPVIYVNGVSLSVTRTTAPVGTYQTPATRLDIGTAGSSISFNMEDFRIYNVIKTASQAAAIALEDIRTDQSIDDSGLVFHAPLTMCKGRTYSNYVGSTLSASNEFYDRINGYTGVPSGSLLGA